MAVPVNSPFARGYAGALDADAVKVDLTARDAIIAGKRYEGLEVYVTAEDTFFVLVGGITNGDWVERSAGGGGSGITEEESIINALIFG